MLNQLRGGIYGKTCTFRDCPVYIMDSLKTLKALIPLGWNQALKTCKEFPYIALQVFFYPLDYGLTCKSPDVKFI